MSSDHTITFSEFPLGTTNPKFIYGDNTVEAVGIVTTDGAQPASPVLAANANYIGPVFLYFAQAVDQVTFDAGYFDALGSSTVEFRDANQKVLFSTLNTQLGIQHFDYSSSGGIKSIAIINSAPDPSGFSLDTVTIGLPANTLAPPVVTQSGPTLALNDRDFGTVDSKGIKFTDTIGGGNAVDYFSFNALSVGTIKITSFLNSNPSKTATATYAVVKGENYFAIKPGQVYNTVQGYTIQAAVTLTSTDKQKIQDELIDDTLANVLGTVFDYKAHQTEIFSEITKGVKNAEDAVSLLTKMSKAFGYLGLLLDLGNRIDNVRSASDPTRQAAIEFSDMLIQIASSGAVGAGLTVAGGPIAGAGGAFVTGVIYTYAISDSVRQWTGQGYDVWKASQEIPFAQSLPPEMHFPLAVQAVAVPQIDVSANILDADYYLSQHPEVKTAILNGTSGSAYLNYIYVGAANGWKPNAASPPIPAASIIHSANGNAAAGYNTAVFSAGFGQLTGDKLSPIESAFTALVNTKRVGATVPIDALLSSIANRTARDWVLNNLTTPGEAFDPGNIDKWGVTLSNGQSVATVFLGFDLDSSNILLIYAPDTDPNAVLAQFMADPAAAAGLLGPAAKSMGIAEFGGVWVAIMSPNASISAATAQNSLVNVSLLGTNDQDLLYAGGGLGNLSGLAGADTLYGGPNADVLSAGTGNDVLTGGAGADTLMGGPGLDRAGYSAARSSYTVTRSGASIIVSGPDGTDTLNGIEVLDFSDMSLNMGQGPSAQDFDQNNISDLVLQNDNGQASFWFLNGDTLASSGNAGANPGPSWHVMGTGDFDGDGKSDLIWQNVNGSVSIWLMNGTTVANSGSPGNPGTAWHVLGTRDFDGNGKSDLLLANDNGQLSIWLMNGIVLANGAAAGPNPGTTWHARALGDFNGDGKGDIALQNDNGQVSIWYMNGTALAGSGAVGGNPGASWRVRGAGDFDGDGLSDLVLQNDNGQPLIWFMNGNSVVSSASLINPGASWRVMGTGDFNGDGEADLIWQNDAGQASVWLMNGATIASAYAAGPAFGTSWHIANGFGFAPSPFRRAPGDFNGDGKSDILLQNDSGQISVWLMNGGALSSSGSPTNPGRAWHAKATGDFDGDGKADILLQNDNGQASIWFMNGATLTSGVVAGPNPGASWSMIGAGDFNSDGKSDILLQNSNGQMSVWFMNGGTLISGVTAGSNPGPSWHAVTTGDFNGDGKSDIVLRNDTGLIAVWLMNGGILISGAAVGSNPGTSWHVRGAADMDGDGKSDILLQNDNGQASTWLMNGTTLTSGVAAGPNPGTSWILKGAVDLDGNGKSELLWQNNISGQVSAWFMSGSTLTSGVSIGAPAGTAWHVLGASGG